MDITNKIKKNQINFFIKRKMNLKNNRNTPNKPKIIPHKKEVFCKNTNPEPGSI